jgi:hypothetical protein
MAVDRVGTKATVNQVRTISPQHRGRDLARSDVAGKRDERVEALSIPTPGGRTYLSRLRRRESLNGALQAIHLLVLLLPSGSTGAPPAAASFAADAASKRITEIGVNVNRSMYRKSVKEA